MSNIFEPWLNYTHSIVRQLAFSIASPDIIQTIPCELHIKHKFDLHSSQFWQQQYLKYEPRLKELDQDPQVLIEFLIPLKSTRLGLKFEYLLWFWLNDHKYHDYQLLGHSIQIIDGKQTLGELDFLLFNTITQEVEHWEVALKFYLGEVDLALENWYGLNRTDTLKRKLTHFTEKQFQFNAINDHIIQKRYVVLKGQLFVPVMNQHMTTLHQELNTIPDWVNTQRQLGTWGNNILNKDYYRLQRQEWICINLNQSSASATWWTNGLYQNKNTRLNYMLRQDYILCRNVKK